MNLVISHSNRFFGSGWAYLFLKPYFPFSISVMISLPPLFSMSRKMDDYPQYHFLKAKTRVTEQFSWLETEENAQRANTKIFPWPTN